MNLPNKLTLTRILLVPVFMIFASLTGLSGIADGSFQPTYYPVSYTHLDVYKRQAMAGSLRLPAARARTAL